MNRSLRWAVPCGFLILGVLASGASAQTPAQRDTLLSAAREIVQAARYCGFATLDESDRVRIRTMDPFLPEEDWSVWMGTNRWSRKVQDIEGDPRVTLFYSSAEHAGYVALYGTARLVDEAAEKSSRWKEEWEAFYSDRDEQYILIQVIPERLEVINYSRGIGGDPESWGPPVVEFSGGG